MSRLAVGADCAGEFGARAPATPLCSTPPKPRSGTGGLNALAAALSAAS